MTNETTTTANVNGNVADVLQNFGAITRPKFVAFTYANEYERASVIVLCGVDVANVYRRDRMALETLQAMETDALRLSVIAELIASIDNSLEKGIGNNDAYTCADVYETFGANMKRHKETGDVYVSGFVVRKTILETFATRKPVKSADKTKIKNAIKGKVCRMAKWRQYKIDAQHIGKVSANGNRLIIA